MAVSVEEIHSACNDLRQKQAALLAPMPQEELVGAVSEWAAKWQDHDSPWRRAAQSIEEPFPFAMTQLSLAALLESLTPDALWALIDSEHVRDAQGIPLAGHVIAGNTPLLVWVSVLRALLMRSASFVKLPSGGSAEWGRLFVRSLSDTTPALASCVHLAQWPGGTAPLDAAVCRDVDLLLAYGGQSTVRDLQALCPPSTAFLGYGHRVSFGLVPAGAASDDAAMGFARDVLLYDQGGCLSPQTIFVQAPWDGVLRFGERLAGALREAVTRSPPASRTPPAAAQVREARLLARMEPDAVVWEGGHLRWTVVARNRAEFAGSPTHGVVSVQPLVGPDELAAAAAPYAGHLQGCAVAHMEEAGAEWHEPLRRLGVSRVCRPGELQTPPFSWREDGRDVLRCLLPVPSPQEGAVASRKRSQMYSVCE